MMLEGSGIRVQGGEEIPVKKDDFWRTPGESSAYASPEGCRVLDIFALPRASTASRERDPATADKSGRQVREQLARRITRSLAGGAVVVRAVWLVPPQRQRSTGQNAEACS